MKHEVFKFKHEPVSPVGSAFQKRWGSNDNPECDTLYLYHYVKESILHIWVDSVAIRIIARGDRPAFGFKNIVLHSDYTLEQMLERNSNPSVRAFIQSLMVQENG